MFWGLWFALLLMLEKLFLGRLLSWLPRGIGIVYTMLAVLAGWVLFALETPGMIWGYLRALTGVGHVLADREALYLCAQYALLFLAAVVASTPLFSEIAQTLRKKRTGWSIALYRFGEKMIPAAILLLAIAGIVDASYNPFLYFRF